MYTTIELTLTNNNNGHSAAGKGNRNDGGTIQYENISCHQQYIVFSSKAKILTLFLLKSPQEPLEFRMYF